MTDSVGVTEEHRLGDRVRAGGFTGVNGDSEQAPRCSIEGGTVSARRPARFAARQIERNHAAIPERDRTFRELERYSGIVVPKRAIDDSGNDSKVPLSLSQAAELCLHYLLQRQTFPLTQMRAVTNLEIAHVVAGRVLDHLVCHPLDGLLASAAGGW